MADARDFFADCCVDAQFLIQFAAQSVARLLAFLDFAARKFPLQRHGLMARALAHQNFAVFDDQGCDHMLH